VTSAQDIGGDVGAFDRARSLYGNGRFAEARTLLDGIVAADPGNLPARYALGLCLNALGDHSAAEPQLRVVVDTDPTQYQAAYELGRALQELGRPAEAVHAFRLVLARRDIPEVRERLRVCAEAARSSPPAGPGSSTDTGAQPSARTGAAPTPGEGDDGRESTSKPLAEEVDERGLVDPGRRIDTTNTKIRHLAPAALVAVAFAWLWVGTVATRHEVYGWIGGGLVAYAIVACVAVFLQADLNRFEFHERRVDISTGVLYRRRQVIWYYDVFQVRLERGPVSLLTNTASLRILYFQGTANQSVTIEGIGTPERVLALYDRLQPLIVRERRAAKKILM
jgi:membrane protein YdbS with pleckstrin-like domain